MRRQIIGGARRSPKIDGGANKLTAAAALSGAAGAGL